MKFRNPFRRNPFAGPAEQLYLKIVAQSRHPDFYLKMGTPDTVDGRFEMIAVHAFIVMRRLKAGDRDASELSQMLFNVMFDDMDRNLREMGVGDLRVGKRVKAMAKVFYGRIVAYEEALAGAGESLEQALIRNHYGTLDSIDTHFVERMADYIRASCEMMDRQQPQDLLDGEVHFKSLD